MFFFFYSIGCRTKGSSIDGTAVQVVLYIIYFGLEIGGLESTEGKPLLGRTTSAPSETLFSFSSIFFVHLYTFTIL